MYRPDLEVVEATLTALELAGSFAKAKCHISLSLTLVDNSDDDDEFQRIGAWLEHVRGSLATWEVRMLRAPGNLGYGRGNNLATENASSDYHLVINPDLFVSENAIFEAVNYLEENRDVGLLTPAVVSENGERQYLCKRNPTLFTMFLRGFMPERAGRVFRSVLYSFEMRDCDYDRPMHPIEYPTGCFMFFRTECLQKIGGFDPNIFLHYEDADIGRRMLQIAGVTYVPSVKVVHKWARDTHKSLHARWLTMKSGWYYWRKWGGVFKAAALAEPPPWAKMLRSARDDNIGCGRRVLVTGANGFVGNAICRSLPHKGFRLTAISRTSFRVSVSDEDVNLVVMKDLDEHTDWTERLSGVDTIVHLAARAHVMNDCAKDPMAEYRRINVDLTANLARQAAVAGVRRFIFMSSIKVNGERTPVGQPFTADDAPRPEDCYGISKLEAEQALWDIARATPMEVVVIRPPLIYGPGVKANFETMMRWVSRTLPLPVGSLDNRRSLVAIENLVDFVAACIAHPKAAGQVFLISDGVDLTLRSILARIRNALGARSIFLPIPRLMIRAAFILLRKELYSIRLLSVLQVDIKKNLHLLGWSPPAGVDEALAKTAMQFATTTLGRRVRPGNAPCRRSPASGRN
jgi:nucleoside-diphosphate-sugar epimerase/GT2 family glycosyltransferase